MHNLMKEYSFLFDLFCSFFQPLCSGVQNAASKEEMQTSFANEMKYLQNNKKKFHSPKKL